MASSNDSINEGNLQEKKITSDSDRNVSNNEQNHEEEGRTTNADQSSFICIPDDNVRNTCTPSNDYDRDDESLAMDEQSAKRNFLTINHLKSTSGEDSEMSMNFIRDELATSTSSQQSCDNFLQYQTEDDTETTYENDDTINHNSNTNDERSIPQSYGVNAGTTSNSHNNTETNTPDKPPLNKPPLPPQIKPTKQSSSSSPSPSASTTSSRFSLWKSKADNVLVNSEMIKAAQKTLMERQKDIAKVMKDQLQFDFSGPVGGSKRSSSSPTSSGKRDIPKRPVSPLTTLEQFQQRPSQDNSNNIDKLESVGMNSNIITTANTTETEINGVSPTQSKHSHLSKVDNSNVGIENQKSHLSTDSLIPDNISCRSSTDDNNNDDDLESENEIDDMDESSYDKRLRADNNRSYSFDDDLISLASDGASESSSVFVSKQSNDESDDLPSEAGESHSISMSSDSGPNMPKSQSDESKMTSEAHDDISQDYDNDNDSVTHDTEKSSNSLPTNTTNNISKDTIEATSSNYRGRYFPLLSPSQNEKNIKSLRPAILQKLQRKVSSSSGGTTTGSNTNNHNTTNTTITNHTLPMRPPTPPRSSSQSPTSAQSRSRRQSSPSTSSLPPTPYEEQLNRILRSPLAPHVESSLKRLNRDEYVMMLGNGMLGVNLKQTYHSKGVYVDLIMPGGNADLSQVIQVGDGLVKVGNVDVTKGTIWNVPSIIAKAKRPVVLILNREVSISGWENMDYIDVAIGMIWKLSEERKKTVRSFTMSSSRDRLSSSEHDGEEKESRETMGSDDSTACDENNGEGSRSMDVVDNVLCIPLPPSKSLRKGVEKYASKRSGDPVSISTLTSWIQRDSSFKNVVTEAFRLCCSDSRRLPFFASYLNSEDSFIANNSGMNQSSSNDIHVAESTRLILYLEIMSFKDLHGVTPSTRALDHAKRIAYKFLLSNPLSKETSSPLFDLRSLFTSDSLESLEKQLTTVQQSGGVISRFIFKDFETTLEASLCGAKFAFFLLSQDGSRMRSYMKSTSPYTDMSVGDLFCQAADSQSKMYHSARKHLAFIINFLLCQSENSSMDKNFETEKEFSKSEKKRLMGGAGGVTCAIYTIKSLIPSIKNVRDILNKTKDNETNQDEYKENEFVSFHKLLDEIEFFWEAFVAPGGGAIESVSHSNESQDVLNDLRHFLCKTVSSARKLQFQEQGTHIIRTIANNEEFIDKLRRFANELIFDYAVNSHPKYRGHLIHDYMCGEARKHWCQLENSDECTARGISIPSLPSGSVIRLMRKIDLPEGVSRHKPSSIIPKKKISSETYESKADKSDDFVTDSKNHMMCADFAIVFGTDGGMDSVGNLPNVDVPATQDLRRFACVPLNQNSEELLNGRDSKSLIPPTLESYASVPALSGYPFSTAVDGSRFSHDGWGVSLIHFMVPMANNTEPVSDESNLYAVSLVFRRNASDKNEKLVDLANFNIKVTSEDDSSGNQNTGIFSGSPLSCEKDNDTDTIIIKTSKPVGSKVFNQRLSESKWSRLVQNISKTDDCKREILLGITLLCRCNTIPAMREALGIFYKDISATIKKASSTRLYSPIVDLLGNFRNMDVEHSVLSSVLDPYLEFACSTWKNDNILDQKEIFEASALDSYVEYLSPIPQALLLIVALLEQKIVFTSRRRSILLSASIALRSLLRPLVWSHLFVPLVPSSLANDLVQYPAPYILGIPSGDKGSMDLLQSLPDDVTLVDIDIGRIILATEFSHNFEKRRNADEQEISGSTLRSQILYLAESLGSVIGTCQSEPVWLCDSPLHVDGFRQSLSFMKKADTIRNIANSFIQELLTGCNTSCYMISESDDDAANAKDCDILFDEDRFFHIKNSRASGSYIPLFPTEDYFNIQKDNQNSNLKKQKYLGAKSEFALNMDDFDLILEIFLRGQGFSAYINSIPKETMAYW